jgi:hypothetical protein
MKITRAELKSIINEVLSEVADSDKFTKALETLNKKSHAQNVALQQTRVAIAKVKEQQSQSRTQQSSDAVDAAESRGNDSGNEQDALNNAEKAEKNAKDNVTAAENNLKAAQKGGTGI